MNIGILTGDKSFEKKLQNILGSTKNKVFSGKPLESTDKNCQWIYDKYCSMVFMDFIEEDLISVKVMESIQNKVDRKISFVFLFPDSKITSDYLENMVVAMNYGALGFMLKETPEKKSEHYVRELIKRHKNTIQEEDKGKELALQTKKTAVFERTSHRLHEINRKKNRFILDNFNDSDMEEIKILFLSNSKFRHEKFRDFFTETGFPFSIATATTVKLAEEECHEEPPDIIISDYILPDGTALDLNTSIRAQKGLSTIRLLVLTSDEKNMREVEKAENKIDEMMIRPSNRDEYLELLARVLMLAKLPTVLEGQ